MSTRTLLLFAGVVAAATIATPTSASCSVAACSCRPDSALGRTVAEKTMSRRDAADAVFLGTVIREDTIANGGPIVARLRVART